MIKKFNSSKLPLLITGAVIAITMASYSETAKADDCLLDANNNGVADLFDDDRAADSAGDDGRLACGTFATAVGEGSTAVGYDSTSLGRNATALGFQASANQAGSTAIGANAASTAENQVALGGAGSSVRIGDIDASTLAQEGEVDVVTIDQNGTLGRQQAASAASVANIRVSMNTLSAVTDAQFTALESRLLGLEGQVSTFFDLTDSIDRDAQRGIASIAAQANPHFPSAAGKTSYASNVAVYRGEVGVSAGLMHRFDGDLAITAGVTYAGGNSTSIRAGIAGEF